MMHTKLGIGIASTRKFVQNFGINHGSPCFETVFIKEPGPVELKGAIYVTHTQAKYQAHQHFPPPGIEFAQPCILAVYAITQYRVIFINERKETLQVGNVKLSIGVHKKGQIFGDHLKTTHQGSAVALIVGVIDKTHARVCDSNLFNNATCAISTAVINDNNLEIFQPL